MTAGHYHVRVKGHGCRNWQLLPATARQSLKLASERLARIIAADEVVFKRGQVIQAADPRKPLVVLEMVRR